MAAASVTTRHGCCSGGCCGCSCRCLLLRGVQAHDCVTQLQKQLLLRVEQLMQDEPEEGRDVKGRSGPASLGAGDSKCWVLCGMSVCCVPHMGGAPHAAGDKLPASNWRSPLVGLTRAGAEARRYGWADVHLQGVEGRCGDTHDEQTSSPGTSHLAQSSAGFHGRDPKTQPTYPTCTPVPSPSKPSLSRRLPLQAWR